MGKATVVLLEIDATGNLVDPLPGRAEPDSHVAFVVINNHADTFDVDIDPPNIVLKQDRTKKANPFATAHRHKEVKSGEIDVIKQKTRPLGDFGSAALPFTTYKYSVVVTNKTASTSVTVDPDFDIPPP